MLKKINKNSVLQLDEFLSFPNISDHKEIHSTEDKRIVLTQLEDFVYKICGKTERAHHYSQMVCELADELILNGIFNANPRLKNAKRSEPFQLNKKEFLDIQWIFDGEMFGLSIKDPFGKLSKKDILAYLDSKQKNDPLAKRISGGLGIKMIFERLHHYIVNVNPDKFTEVICLLHFDKKFKDFNNRLRSFHYISNSERNIR